MKACFLPLLALVVCVLGAQAKLNVVATLPDYASIAKEIGGDKINVTSLTKGAEDAHFVDARPSLIRVLNKADVLLENGAEMEIGWLPVLVNSARNPKILGDARGHVLMSKGIQMLDVPAGAVDRSMGDVHPLGNPHYWLDPANGKIMAQTIADTLCELDSENAGFYRENLKSFQQKLDKKLADWKQRLEPFRGAKVITYHKSFDYLLDRFGLVLAGTLEPKPGIEPSPTHIKSLVSNTKAEGVKLILVETFRPRKTPEHVAETIGAKLIVCPDKSGATEKVPDYFSLFDYLVTEIAAALR